MDVGEKYGSVNRPEISFIPRMAPLRVFFITHADEIGLFHIKPQAKEGHLNHLVFLAIYLTTDLV